MKTLLMITILFMGSFGFAEQNNTEEIIPLTLNCDPINGLEGSSSFKIHLNAESLGSDYILAEDGHTLSFVAPGEVLESVAMKVNGENTISGNSNAFGLTGQKDGKTITLSFDEGSRGYPATTSISITSNEGTKTYNKECSLKWL